MNLEARTTLGKGALDVNQDCLISSSGLLVTERFDVCCVLCSCSQEVTDTTRKQIEAVLGIDLPPSRGTIAKPAKHTAIWLTPRSWLVLCPPDGDVPMISEIAEAFPDRSVHASPFSDYLCWLEVSGDMAEDTLRAHAFVSIPRSGSTQAFAKRGLVADIPAITICWPNGSFTVAIERSRAEYFVSRLDATARSQERT